MVSDKPPRRSRSGKTPVTLDLAAEDKGIIAEPVRANDTDEPTASTPVDPVADGGNADAITQTTSAADDAPAQSAPAAGEASAPDAPPAKLGSEADPASSADAPATLNDTPKPADIASSEQDSSPFSQTAETQPEAPVSPAAPTTAPLASNRAGETSNKSPSTSAMIAAGIAGGLVALLLGRLGQVRGTQHITLDALIGQKVIQAVSLCRSLIDEHDPIRLVLLCKVQQEIEHCLATLTVVEKRLLVRCLHSARRLEQQTSVVQITANDDNLVHGQPRVSSVK